ncbi:MULTISPECIES: amidohydrolase family protein [Deinococcus]|uniref:Amidohydrolase-related domain-containing protein n=1 Tax=Deinococcus cavernae TaxID=2320857 RepID=A0A418V982_9DEIO|nr:MULTISPECIES: amidohydrolase family protein [Deinococcus]RJF72639.1 hypothetical protein D3875_14910 [Deinococcus cavernae]
MTARDLNLPRLLTCDVLYTGMGGAQSPGGVVLMRDIIAATGHPDELKRNYPHAVVEHVGGIIAPPPVNAHTHLDMSAYEFTALPYFRWIPEVVVGQREKRGVPGALAGADELVRLKVGGVGDIVFAPDVMDALLERHDLQGVLYFELFAPKVEMADAAFTRLRELMAGWRRKARPDGLRLGITPHTPFTVSHRLMRLTAEYAASEGLPMQIHVAEHPTELELFQTGAGPLWDSRLRAFTPDTFAEIIGRPPEPDLTPVRYLDELGVLNATPTLIHMVNVTPDDIGRVARAGCAVVTCPRSNHHLECGTFKWAQFAAAGVEIALGTDSVASGESLDIREEISFARTLYPNLDPRLLVRSAVKGGHRVLGTRAPFIRRGERWTDRYVW